MQAGHSDVVKPLDFVPERLGSERRLLGDGNVAGAGCGHDHGPDAVGLSRCADAHKSCLLKILDTVAQRSGDLRGLRGIYAGRNGRNLSIASQRREHARNLLCRLALAEYDFGHALSPKSVQVNTGEPQIVHFSHGSNALFHTCALSHISG